MHHLTGHASSSKAVAIGGLALMTEGEGKVTIDRTKRPWKTFLKSLTAPLKAIALPARRTVAA